MSLAGICRTVRQRWHNLTQVLWPTESKSLTQTEMERLTEEVNRRYRTLVARRVRIERLRDRLARHEHELQTTPTEELKRAVERQRLRLARLEAGYAERCRVLDQKKRVQRQLLRGDVVVEVGPS